MTFDLRKFERFCRELTVETKERGLQKLGTQLLGTQKYLMQEIGKGLEEGKGQRRGSRRSIEDRYAESVRLALAWVGVVRRDRRGSGTAKGAGNGVWEWRGRAP